MQDLSQHILDIIENSISAQASKIRISILLNISENKLKINIMDNGLGMDEELIKQVQSPFYTSKKNRKRKVGLGIPLFKQNAEMCGGSFSITSEKSLGTRINAVFQYNHIDRMPIGKLADTLLNSIMGHQEVDFIIDLRSTYLNGIENSYTFSTQEVKKEINGIPLTYPDVYLFIQSNLNEEIKKIKLEDI